jgi:hypothetical protein
MVSWICHHFQPYNTTIEYADSGIDLDETDGVRKWVRNRRKYQPFSRSQLARDPLFSFSLRDLLSSFSGDPGNQVSNLDSSIVSWPPPRVECRRSQMSYAHHLIPHPNTVI